MMEKNIKTNTYICITESFCYAEEITQHCKSTMKLKVDQSCQTLYHPVDYTVHEILQARILEWVAFLFSRGSSQPRDRTQVSCIASRFLTSWATRETQEYWSGQSFPFPGDLLYPGIQPVSPVRRETLYHLSHQGSMEFLLLGMILSTSDVTIDGL